jgi:hypothetical protein
MKIERKRLLLYCLLIFFPFNAQRRMILRNSGKMRICVKIIRNVSVAAMVSVMFSQELAARRKISDESYLPSAQLFCVQIPSDIYLQLSALLFISSLIISTSERELLFALPVGPPVSGSGEGGTV